MAGDGADDGRKQEREEKSADLAGKPPTTFPGVFALDMSDDFKLWMKKYRTPLSSGTASVFSTFIAVCDA